MKITTALMVAAVVIVFGGVGFLYSGLYNVGADVPHWPVTAKLIDILRERSIEARAEGLQAPDLTDPKLIAMGADHYAEMCTGCHLKPGQENSEIRQGLYPVPPDLTQHRDDPDEQFWVIKHGIKLTAMPAWGKTHSDEKIWAMVAFLQKLPGLTPEQYQQMTPAATTDEDEDSDEPGEHSPAAHRDDHTH